MRRSVTASGAAAVGPYSHGVEANGLVFLSGQTPLDASTGGIMAGGFDVQVRQCFWNLGAVLDAAGLAWGDVVKCDVFLTEMGDFAAMNAIYVEQFEAPYPARTTIGVASLPLGARGRDRDDRGRAAGRARGEAPPSVNALLFATTVLIWGTTWIAIAAEIGPVPVLVSVFYRFALAAVILVAILAAARSLSAPALRHHPYIAAQALCLFSCNFICFYAATAFIPSGFVSVVFSLATLFNAVNGRLLFGTPITGWTMLAAGMVLVGLMLLFGPGTAVGFDVGTLKGIGLAALGTLLFSLGNMASRRHAAHGLPPGSTNAWGMAYGALTLLVLIGCTRMPVVAPPSWTYSLALVYLAAFGSVMAFTTYLSLVARIGPSKAAYTTVLFPIVALSASTFYEGYQWHWTGVLGLIIALSGNILIFSNG